MPDFLTQGDMPAILTLAVLAIMLVVFLMEIYPPEVTAMGGAAASLLNLAGRERGERLRASVRRRWNAVEACETTSLGRLRGGAVAAAAALSKATGRTAPAG